MTSDLIWSYTERSGFKLCSLNHYKTNLLVTGECFCPQAHITSLAIAHNCLNGVFSLDRGLFDPERYEFTLRELKLIAYFYFECRKIMYHKVAILLFSCLWDFRW